MNIVSLEYVWGFTILIARSVNSIYYFELIDTKGEVYVCSCSFLSAQEAELMANEIIDHELNRIKEGRAE